jgi:hypothetical protein
MGSADSGSVATGFAAGEGGASLSFLAAFVGVAPLAMVEGFARYRWPGLLCDEAT